mmetsp:Transcript_13862/g.43147  ORF Transcript_13862/g.43147 Transcript_13862/m.43147 type:complete len:285 (+) Transcript_13862:652-1506(+)
MADLNDMRMRQAGEQCDLSPHICDRIGTIRIKRNLFHCEKLAALVVKHFVNDPERAGTEALPDVEALVEAVTSSRSRIAGRGAVRIREPPGVGLRSTAVAVRACGVGDDGETRIVRRPARLWALRNLVEHVRNVRGDGRRGDPADRRRVDNVRGASTFRRAHRVRDENDERVRRHVSGPCQPSLFLHVEGVQLHSATEFDAGYVALAHTLRELRGNHACDAVLVRFVLSPSGGRRVDHFHREAMRVERRKLVVRDRVVRCPEDQVTMRRGCADVRCRTVRSHGG